MNHLARRLHYETAKFNKLLSALLSLSLSLSLLFLLPPPPLSLPAAASVIFEVPARMPDPSHSLVGNPSLTFV